MLVMLVMLVMLAGRSVVARRAADHGEHRVAVPR
jgi:hypothetical protein